MSPATNVHRVPHTARILVADPDPDTRSLYRQSLRLTACDVVDAADGRDALVKALSVRPTLVITETRLPVLDGYALCQVLRRDSMTATVPILIVTAETRPRELDRARKAGADAVIQKPVTPETLLGEIQRLLEPPAEPPRTSSASSSSHPHAEQRRMSLAKAHRREQTTTPPAPPPQMTCPSCESPLQYEHSHIGGVSRRHAEQWDAYTCPRCGMFEYRHRTRRLRRVG